MPNFNPFARRGDDERRSGQRYKVDLPVHVKAWRNGAFASLSGRGYDLNENGMAVEVAGALQVGESVSIEMRLPSNERPLMITGSVRHAKESLYGLEFVRMGESQRKMIVEFCEATLQKR